MGTSPDLEIDFGLIKLTPEQMLNFRPSEDVHDHAEILVDKSKNGLITEQEEAELKYFTQFVS